MSITDSSTTLDTAWNEQSLVKFEYGVLSSIANCVSEVESKLQRGTLSTGTTPTLAQVQGWLKRGKLELMEHKDYSFSRKYAYVDLTADTYRYSLPGDFSGGDVRLVDTTNDRSIIIWDSSKYDRRFPDPSEETSNEVLVACIKNMELWVAPPPDSSDRLELQYPRSGAETTADDFTWLPELERFRCCDFALANAFEALHQYAVADRYYGRWNEGLIKSRRADGRKKWLGIRQAINVFQEASQRNWQGGKYYRP